MGYQSYRGGPGAKGPKEPKVPWGGPGGFPGPLEPSPWSHGALPWGLGTSPWGAGALPWGPPLGPGALSPVVLVPSSGALGTSPGALALLWRPPSPLPAPLTAWSAPQVRGESQGVGDDVPHGEAYGRELRARTTPLTTATPTCLVAASVPCSSHGNRLPEVRDVFNAWSCSTSITYMPMIFPPL